jgi:tripartite-type tricarboxylate transporter receptor subunit TctC
MAKSGSLLGGSSGVGSPGHLALELFNMMAGTKIVHVAYKGSAPALIDIIAGNIQLTFATAATAVPLMRAGKIKGLGVTTLKRTTVLPELPTISESGLPVSVSGWYGISRRQAPRSIINRLNAEIVKALQMPDVRQNLSARALISARNARAVRGFIKSKFRSGAKRSSIRAPKRTEIARLLRDFQPRSP